MPDMTNLYDDDSFGYLAFTVIAHDDLDVHKRVIYVLGPTANSQSADLVNLASAWKLAAQLFPWANSIEVKAGY